MTGGRRGDPPTSDAEDARELLRQLQAAGATVRVTRAGRLRIDGTSDVPGVLLRRVAERGEAIRAELGPGQPCRRCGGVAFYRRGRRWRCVRCSGVPRIGGLPSTWALADGEPRS